MPCIFFPFQSLFKRQLYYKNLTEKIIFAWAIIWYFFRPLPPFFWWFSSMSGKFFIWRKTEINFSQSPFAVRNSNNSSWPVTGLGSKGPLKVLNGTKLILDDHRKNLNSFRISLESFRSFRGPLHHKPVTSQKLFFVVSYSSSKVLKNMKGPKAITYDECSFLKRDARVNTVFFHHMLWF